MSSFHKILNENKQFIIAIKVIKCPSIEQYKDGTAQKLITKASLKRALIDTGASGTCITQEFADELKLIPIEKQVIGTAGNPCEVYMYKVDFAIPVTNTKSTLIKENEKETLKQIPIGEDIWAHAQYKVSSTPRININRGFDFILGMDILSKMHITLFQGQIIMSF